MVRHFSGILIAMLACGAIGCGNEFGSTVAVTGKITVAGKAAEKARIIFHASNNKLPAEFRTVTAELKPDGTFSLEKVYLAEYTVMFESLVVMDATKSAEPTPSPLTAYGADSKLRAKVTADKTKFDFDLPAEPPKSASGQLGGVPGFPGGIPGQPGGR